MPIQDLIRDAEERRVGFYKAASASLSRGGGGSYSGGGGGSPYAAATDSTSIFGDQVTASADRQYRAASGGWQAAAMRPIAVRVADQPFRCGYKKVRGSAGSGKDSGSPAGRGFRKKSFDMAPGFIRKQMSEGLEQDDNHPLLDLLERPNSYMTGWANLYCTALSMQATGLAYWWVENLNADQTVIPSAADQMRIWYFPTSWVTPIHTEEEPFKAFKVQPPGVIDREAQIVPGEDMLRFVYPNPANPLGALSPMQTQARAINTDDEIQKAQHASMVNGARPGMIMTVGRLDNPSGMGLTGQGPRPILTPEQRNQLTTAARLAYAGAMHNMDPFIIDGMIENVAPYTLNPVDLDFPNGSQLTKERIFQGIGTNPVVAGQIEGANRASSWVAQDNFDRYVVNPLGTQISQTATMKLGPRFEEKSSRGRFYIWIERAVAHDDDVENKKTDQLLAGEAITKDELRERCGMAPMKEGGDEIAAPAKPEPMGPAGATGPTRPGGAGSGGGKPSSKPRR